jgi:NADH:ubiquinone oxidoreductase subunit K
MMLVAGIIGGMGIICMISRNTMLGLLVGMQLLVLGASLAFVIAGLSSGLKIYGQAFGFFITLGGIAQLAVGYALSIRLFFLKKKITLDQIQSLKK